MISLLFANGSFALDPNQPNLQVRAIRRVEHGDWKTQLARKEFLGLNLGEAGLLEKVWNNLYGQWCRVRVGEKTSDVRANDLEVILLTETIQHAGVEYEINHGPDASLAEYVEDALTTDKRPAYRFRVMAGHIGLPIEILMVNPHDESDEEGGIWFCWDALLWADDETPFGDPFDDIYSDALRDELSEIAKNWTSRNG